VSIAIAGYKKERKNIKYIDFDLKCIKKSTA
jgi:hypothetical protein